MVNSRVNTNTFDQQVTRGDVSPLIPEEVSNALLRNLSASSAAMSLFPKIQMSTNQTRMPVLAALPTAYWVTGDTGLKQTTQVSWSNKYLNVEELAAIVPIPEAVFDDLSFDVWDRVTPLIENAMVRAIDDAIFFGVNKPASWPDAIVPAATAAGHVTKRNNTAADIPNYINDTFVHVESDGYDVDFVLAHRSYKGILRNVRSALGTTLPEMNPESVFGVGIQYPLRGLWPMGNDKAEMIVGNSQEGIIGMRSDMSLKVLDQAVIQDGSGNIIYNLPQQDMIALRVVMRLAWTVANTIQYDNLDEATRYPFAIMTGTGTPPLARDAGEAAPAAPTKSR